jgi:polynucleotide 5'-hydroxyl-kinase GRC3/NOL9
MQSSDTDSFSGPSFTHQTIPHSAHYIGATTPRDAPARYIAAIEACLSVYRLDIANAVDLPDEHDADEDDGRIADLVPLVVNTMGWTKGLGADLNQQVANLVTPTHTFEFSPLPYGDKDGSFQIPPLTAAEVTGCGLVRFLDPVQSPLSSYFTAADHRALNILSYFHSIFPTNSNPRNSIAKAWSPSHLLARAPYEVEWRAGLPGGLILSAPGAEDVVPEEVAFALPGAIVALITEEIDDMLNETPHSGAGHNSSLNYTQGRLAPSPRSSHCLGLALIRGLADSPLQPLSSDSSSAAPASGAIVQMLTPMPPVLLGHAHTAVKGALELPIWGMLDASSKEDGVTGWPRSRVPYLRWANVREDVQPHGADRRRVRRNLMRKGQM